MKKIFLYIAFLQIFLAPSMANAAITINIYQNGSDVIASGSGSFDIDGMYFVDLPDDIENGFIGSYNAAVRVGNSKEGLYFFVDGPGDFGTIYGVDTVATSSSGDTFGVRGANANFFLPSGYVSGTSLSGRSTFANTSLAALKLVDGTYVYKAYFGSMDTITVNIGNSMTAVPEPSTWIFMIAGFMGIASMLRRKSRSAPASFA